jgi:hypothetical protein
MWVNVGGGQLPLKVLELVFLQVTNRLAKDVKKNL